MAASSGILLVCRQRTSILFWLAYKMIKQKNNPCFCQAMPPAERLAIVVRLLSPLEIHTHRAKVYDGVYTQLISWIIPEVCAVVILFSSII